MSNENTNNQSPTYLPVINEYTGADGLIHEDAGFITIEPTPNPEDEKSSISFALSEIAYVDLENTDDVELPPGSRIGAFGKTVPEKVPDSSVDPVDPNLLQVALNMQAAFDHMRSTIGTHMRRDLIALDNSHVTTPVLNPGSLPPRDQLHPNDIEAHNLYTVTLKGLRAYLSDDPYRLPLEGLVLEHVELPRVYASADGDPAAEYEVLEVGYETIQITKGDMSELGLNVRFGSDQPDTVLLNTGVTHVELYSYGSEGELDVDNSFSLVHDDKGFTTLISSGSQFEAPIDSPEYAEALEAAEQRLVNYFDKISLFPGFWEDNTPSSLPDAAKGLQPKPTLLLKALQMVGLADKETFTKIELQPGDQSKVQPDYRRHRTLP